MSITFAIIGALAALYSCYCAYYCYKVKDGVLKSLAEMEAKRSEREGLSGESFDDLSNKSAPRYREYGDLS